VTLTSLGADIEQAVRTGGPETGTRVIRLTSGDLQADLLPDRGLDVGQVRVAGIPFAYLSGVGFPRWSNESEDAFARSFGGGLLVTCGLRNFGPASEGQPMHGRIGSLPARVTRVEAGDRGALVEGVVRETGLFDEPLELRRRVESPAPQRMLRITDTITNLGSSPTELMTLYHVNFGAPLVGEGTTLRTSALDVQPRDDDARAGFDSWHSFPTPSRGFREQVFVHTLPRDRLVEATVTARSGLQAVLRWNSAELPGLIQWRIADPARSVLGVEPCDTPTILGRADARTRDLLRWIAPGDSVTRTLEIGFSLPPDCAHCSEPRPNGNPGGKTPPAFGD